MERNVKKAFEYFDLNETATLEDFKNIYRLMMKENHPDKFLDQGEKIVEEKTKKCQEINAQNIIIMKYFNEHNKSNSSSPNNNFTKSTTSYSPEENYDDIVNKFRNEINSYKNNSKYHENKAIIDLCDKFLNKLEKYPKNMTFYQTIIIHTMRTYFRLKINKIINDYLEKEKFKNSFIRYIEKIKNTYLKSKNIIEFCDDYLLKIKIYSKYDFNKIKDLKRNFDILIEEKIKYEKELELRKIDFKSSILELKTVSKNKEEVLKTCDEFLSKIDSISDTNELITIQVLLKKELFRLEEREKLKNDLKEELINLKNMYQDQEKVLKTCDEYLLKLDSVVTDLELEEIKTKIKAYKDILNQKFNKLIQERDLKIEKIKKEIRLNFDNKELIVIYNNFIEELTKVTTYTHLNNVSTKYFNIIKNLNEFQQKENDDLKIEKEIFLTKYIEVNGNDNLNKLKIILVFLNKEEFVKFKEDLLNINYLNEIEQLLEVAFEKIKLRFKQKFINNDKIDNRYLKIVENIFDKCNILNFSNTINFVQNVINLKDPNYFNKCLDQFILVEKQLYINKKRSEILNISGLDSKKIALFIDKLSELINQINTSNFNSFKFHEIIEIIDSYNLENIDEVLMKLDCFIGSFPLYIIISKQKLGKQLVITDEYGLSSDTYNNDYYFDFYEFLKDSKYLNNCSYDIFITEGNNTTKCKKVTKNILYYNEKHNVFIIYDFNRNKLCLELAKDLYLGHESIGFVTEPNNNLLQIKLKLNHENNNNIQMNIEEVYNYFCKIKQESFIREELSRISFNQQSDNDFKKGYIG